MPPTNTAMTNRKPNTTSASDVCCPSAMTSSTGASLEPHDDDSVAAARNGRDLHLESSRSGDPAQRDRRGRRVQRLECDVPEWAGDGDRLPDGRPARVDSGGDRTSGTGRQDGTSESDEGNSFHDHG